MPAKKRYTTEQIVAKLREAEKLQAQGSTIPHVRPPDSRSNLCECAFDDERASGGI